MIRPQWKGPPKDVPPTEALPPKQQASASSPEPAMERSRPDDQTVEDPIKANPKDPPSQVDIDMEALTGSLATTSLGLVPPSVARKQKKKALQA